MTASLIRRLTEGNRDYRKNVLSGVRKIRDGFASHPGLSDTVVRGAVYDIVSGEVVWL